LVATLATTFLATLLVALSGLGARGAACIVAFLLFRALIRALAATVAAALVILLRAHLAARGAALLAALSTLSTTLLVATLATARVALALSTTLLATTLAAARVALALCATLLATTLAAARVALALCATLLSTGTGAALFVLGSTCGVALAFVTLCHFVRVYWFLNETHRIKKTSAIFDLSKALPIPVHGPTPDAALAEWLLVLGK